MMLFTQKKISWNWKKMKALFSDFIFKIKMDEKNKIENFNLSRETKLQNSKSWKIQKWKNATFEKKSKNSKISKVEIVEIVEKFEKLNWINNKTCTYLSTPEPLARPWKGLTQKKMNPNKQIFTSTYHFKRLKSKLTQKWAERENKS